MSKKFGFVLLAALVIAFVPASALFACSADCGAGGKCTGTGTCGCDENGKASCSDQQQTIESLTAQATYARSFNTSGLNRFADSAQRLADALASGDKDAYFLAVLEREDALKFLTPQERQILNSWDGGDHKLSLPLRK